MKKMSQKQKVLQLLMSKPVVFNTELNKICFRYSGRIHELKKKNIFVSDGEYVKKGVYSYRLLTKPKDIDFDKCRIKEV